MITKRILSALLSFAFILAISIPTVAYETTAVGNNLYAKESVAAEIKSKMFADDSSSYYFLFGTHDVTFDFEKAMPFYVLNHSKSSRATAAADMLEYAGYYIVPVLDKDNNFIAFAEFKQITDSEDISEMLKQYSDKEYENEYNKLLDKYTNHSGEWEIIGASTGGYTEQFYKFIKSDNNVYKRVMSYEKAYLTEDNSGYNILLVSENEEQYFSFYKYLKDTSALSSKNDSFFISGKELLKEAKEQYENYKGADTDSAGTADNTVDLNSDENELAEDLNSDEASEKVPNPETGTNSVLQILTLISLGAICVIGINKRFEK